MLRWICLAPLLGVAMAATAGPARAQVTPLLIPPVDGVVSRWFEAPASAYGPGHRGIDYDVTPGTSVRAAGPGVVSFAGSVAGRLAVTIDHAGGLQSTYSILKSVSVHAGDSVGEGAFIGESDMTHPGEEGGLHFGVKLNGEYVDPMDYLGPLDMSDAIHLAPLVEMDATGARVRSAAEPSECHSPRSIHAGAPSPNDNIAVAVSGLSSATLGGNKAHLYDPAVSPIALGYPPRNVYLFSYEGPNGPHLHEPFASTATYEPITESARKLRALLIRIARRHPGVDVDVIAHSQGGLVARAMLERMASAWDPRLPRVEHLITVATPHTGAPLAHAAGDIDRNSATGWGAMAAMSEWARANGPLPDPRSQAVADLRPESHLIHALATEDIGFGTRVLALGSPLDLLVPADRSAYPGKESHLVSASGPDAHTGILYSPAARRLEYHFLRDGGAACSTSTDAIGMTVGRVIGAAESHLGAAYRLFEELLPLGARALAPAVRWVGGTAVAGLGWVGRAVAGAGRAGGD